MHSKEKIYLVGAACGLGAGNPGCQDGPAALQASPLFQDFLKAHPQFIWDKIFTTRPVHSPEARWLELTRYLKTLAIYCRDLRQARQSFIVIGGDHACAIATWSGHYAGLQQNAGLGMLWVDAHMDCHTHETSETGNVHGMPVAALLGYTDKALSQLLSPHVKVDAAHLAFCGIRSFELGEFNHLKRNQVAGFFMDDITDFGLSAVIRDALAVVRGAPDGYGVSIDLDGLDPKDAPGVGTPVNNGINGDALCATLKGIAQDEKFLGLEIAEFNPHLDKEDTTIKTIIKLIKAVYCG